MTSPVLRPFLAGFTAVAATFILLKPSVLHAESQAAGALTETYAQANSALMTGDVETWNRLVPLTEDFVLFSPFGGKPSRFADYTPEKYERMGRFFKNGTFDQEVVQTFVSADMIVLATIERAHVGVGGLPAQNWALRVTSVFKREGSQWKLAHRHADPFVEDVPLAQSARIARGERDAAVK